MRTEFDFELKLITKSGVCDVTDVTDVSGVSDVCPAISGGTNPNQWWQLLD